jgi:hypothetical protein
MLGRASPLRKKHEFEIVEFNMSSYGIHCRLSVFISYRSMINDQFPMMEIILHELQGH